MSRLKFLELELKKLPFIFYHTKKNPSEQNLKIAQERPNSQFSNKEKMFFSDNKTMACSFNHS